MKKHILNFVYTHNDIGRLCKVLEDKPKENSSAIILDDVFKLTSLVQNTPIILNDNKHPFDKFINKKNGRKRK